MNAYHKLGWVVLVCIAGAIVYVGAATPVVKPEERDPQVLQTLLLHLLNDPNFDMTPVSTNEATIVLHTDTPEGAFVLKLERIRNEIGKHTLPGDAEEDVRR